MKISSVRVIRPKDRTSPVLCFADVVLSSGVLLRDIRLVRGRKRKDPPELKMPVQRDHAGTYRETFRPISYDAYRQLRHAILDALKKAQKEDVNTYSLTYEEAQVPAVFKDVRVFPVNHPVVKGFAIAVVDDAILLDRMTLMVSEETQMFHLVFPSQYVARAGGMANFYRMGQDDYRNLYNEVITVYSTSKDGSPKWVNR